jgi:Organic radical activating enzymes
MAISYPVMEHFYSIQGEGYYQGQAAYFVRLGGCDVGCVWCDVKDSWDTSAHPIMSVSDILFEIQKTKAKIIVITGGEPLMHDCTALTSVLQYHGYQVHLETSGAYPLSGLWNWICVSPKKFKAPLSDVLIKANELKVIVYHKSDIQWAQTHAANVSSQCKLYLQPEWSKQNEMTDIIFQHVLQHPEWQISLQIHKFMEVD